MEDYISEAEALSEIYDGFEGNFEPYSKSDRHDYVDAKSRTFRKTDVGFGKLTLFKTINLVDSNILCSFAL